MASIYYGGHNAAYGQYFNEAAATQRYYNNYHTTSGSDAVISGCLVSNGTATPASGSTPSSASVYPQAHHLSFPGFSADGRGYWDSITAAAAVQAATSVSAVQKRTQFANSYQMMSSCASSSPCSGADSEHEAFPSGILPYSAAAFLNDGFHSSRRQQQLHHHHHQHQQHPQPLKQHPKNSSQLHHLQQSSFSTAHHSTTDQCDQVVRCSPPSRLSYQPQAADGSVASSSPLSAFCSPDASLVDISPPPPPSSSSMLDTADANWTQAGRVRNSGNRHLENASPYRHDVSAGRDATRQSIRNNSK